MIVLTLITKVINNDNNDHNNKHPGGSGGAPRGVHDALADPEHRGLPAGARKATIVNIITNPNKYLQS